MKKTVFDVSAGVAVDGVKQATAKVQEVFKIPKDQSVRVYQQLKPEDFNAIVAEFGPEATMEYIRRMETRLYKNER